LRLRKKKHRAGNNSESVYQQQLQTRNMYRLYHEVSWSLTALSAQKRYIVACRS